LLVGFSFSFEAEESFKNLYMVGGGPFSFLFFEEKGRRGGEGGFQYFFFQVSGGIGWTFLTKKPQLSKKKNFENWSQIATKTH
jgi:hypothetical protein